MKWEEQLFYEVHLNFGYSYVLRVGGLTLWSVLQDTNQNHIVCSREKKITEWKRVQRVQSTIKAWEILRSTYILRFMPKVYGINKLAWYRYFSFMLSNLRNNWTFDLLSWGMINKGTLLKQLFAGGVSVVSRLPLKIFIRIATIFPSSTNILQRFYSARKLYSHHRSICPRRKTGWVFPIFHWSTHISSMMISSKHWSTVLHRQPRL